MISKGDAMISKGIRCMAVPAIYSLASITGVHLGLGV
jgi:hypothetical protein